MHFHWLYIISFLDVVATSLLVPFLTAHLHEAGFDQLKVGLLISVYPTVQLLSSPAAGLFLDRYGHKQSLIFSLLACAVAYYGLGSASCPLSVFLWRVALGFLKHTQTICKSLLVIDKATYQFGVLNAAETFGFMFGPFVGAQLVKTNIDFTFLCNTTSSLFLLNAVIVCYCCLKDKYQDLANKSVLKNDLDVLKKYQETPIIDWTEFWDIFVIKWFLCVSLSMFYTNYSFIMVQKLKVAPCMLGYTNSFQSLLSLITGLVHANISKNNIIIKRNLKFNICCSILSISLLCSGFVTNFPMFIFCLMPLSISSTLLKIYTTEMLFHKASSTYKGPLIGLENTISSVAFLLSPFIVEICSRCFGSFYVLFFSSLISGACACLPCLIKMSKP